MEVEQESYQAETKEIPEEEGHSTTRAAKRIADGRV